MTEAVDQLLAALRASVDHLTQLVVGLDDRVIEQSAYPEDWSVADVMSHVGSGAVIMQRRVDDALAGSETPDEFAPEVWATWDARSSRSKVDDGREADRAFLRRLESLSGEERRRLAFSLGPLTVDFAGVVGLRLNEHLLHTWDIEVVLTPGAALLPTGLPYVLDNLGLIARFSARPTGSARTMHIRTADPVRRFVVDLRPDAVEFGLDDNAAPVDLELPAEAFVRLVYGRLGPAHTPTVTTGADLLDELRRVYPGP